MFKLYNEYGLYNTAGRIWELYLPSIDKCLTSLDLTELLESMYVQAL